MNYIEQVRSKLVELLPDCEPELIDLYTLVGFLTGGEPLLSDIHDAWAIFRNRTMPEHRSIVPFDELAPAVQKLDVPYRDAVATAFRSAQTMVGESEPARSASSSTGGSPSTSSAGRSPRPDQTTADAAAGRKTSALVSRTAI